MDSIDGLVQIFFLILVIGSGVAGWLRKKREEEAARRAASEAPPAPPVLRKLEDLLEEIEERAAGGEAADPLRRERRGTAPSRPVQRPAPRPRPPVAVEGYTPLPPVGQLEHSRLAPAIGEASFSAEIEAAFDTSELSTLAQELAGRQLGQFVEGAAPEEVAGYAGVAFASSWSEAVILRELLGPPLALRGPDRPALHP